MDKTSQNNEIKIYGEKLDKILKFNQPKPFDQPESEVSNFEQLLKFLKQSDTLNKDDLNKFEQVYKIFNPE